ncbi:UDP-forming cellulose synthase catalytic subunit [Klebsiella pneumoniae]
MKKSLFWLLALVLSPVAVLVVITPMDSQKQYIFGLLSIGILFLMGFSKRRSVSVIMVVTSLLMSTRYMYFRLTQTLHFNSSIEAILGMGLFLAEVYIWVMLLLNYLQTVWPLKRGIVPLPDDMSKWPTVDIYIPSYNEPLEVVRDTVLAAQCIDYPKDKMKIYLLDDGKRSEFAVFAADVGVGYITRNDNKHAKAGNLNHALTLTQGELICVFDCDHVATRVFLQATVGGFLKDPMLALVQTPHYFYSPDPFERNLSVGRNIPNEGMLFYGPIQQGNDNWNATFFCGSCAVIRREALAQIGGFAVETVTEDAHTALKFQRLGWKSAFLDIPLAAGLATERLVVHVIQRTRWARGMTQIFRVDNPLFGRGLTFQQRLCYLSAMLYYQFALPRVVFVTAPLAYLLFNLNIIYSSASLIVSYALPHLFLAIYVGSRMNGRYRYSFWGEIYDIVLAFHLVLPTLVTMIFPKRGKFNVTDKGGLLDVGYFDFTVVRPHLVVACLLALGVIVGIVSRSHTADLSMGGCRVVAPDNRHLEDDIEEIELILQSGAISIPAQLVTSDERFLRLKFDEDIPLSRRRELVRVVLARADAWINPPRPQDNPFRSFFTILRCVFELFWLTWKTRRSQRNRATVAKTAQEDGTL